MPSTVKLIQLLLSLLSGVLVFIGTSKYGIGLSPDGISYLSAALSLQKDFQLLDYDGGIFAAWPPLYPCILALGGSILGEIQEFARFLNVFCAVAISYMVFEFLKRSGVNSIITSLLTLSVAGSFPLLKNGVMLWSESLFIAHVLCFFLLMQSNYSASDRYRHLVLLALVSLIPLQRYLGVTVVVTFIMYKIVSLPRGSIPHYLRALIGYSTLFLPLIIWCLRNKFLTGHLTGVRVPSTVTVSGIVWRLYDIGAGALLPIDVTEAIVTPLKCAVAVCVLLALGAGGYRSMVERGKGGASIPIQIVEIHTLFVCVYIGVLCLGILFVGLEPLSIRYISPVIPSVVIVVGNQISTIKKYQSIPLIILIFFTFQTVLTSGKILNVLQEEGAGDYSVRGWKESPTLQWLKENKVSGEVFSNASDFVFIETGQLFSRLPSSLSLNSKQFSINSEMTLVFFARSFRRYMAKREDFYPYCSITPVAQFSDGGIYTCTPARTAVGTTEGF